MILCSSLKNNILYACTVSVYQCSRPISCNIYLLKKILHYPARSFLLLQGLKAATEVVEVDVLLLLLVHGAAGLQRRVARHAGQLREVQLVVVLLRVRPHGRRSGGGGRACRREGRLGGHVRREVGRGAILGGTGTPVEGDVVAVAGGGKGHLAGRRIGHGARAVERRLGGVLVRVLEGRVSGMAAHRGVGDGGHEGRGSATTSVAAVALVQVVLVGDRGGEVDKGVRGVLLVLGENLGKLGGS